MTASSEEVSLKLPEAYRARGKQIFSMTLLGTEGKKDHSHLINKSYVSSWDSACYGFCMYNPFKLVVRCFTSCFYIKFQNKCYFTLKKPIISSVKQLHVVEEHRNKRLVLQVELLGRTLGKCAVLTGAALLMTEPVLLLFFFFRLWAL